MPKGDKARQGLNQLLEQCPDATVVHIWNQDYPQSWSTGPGPWTIVDLKDSEPKIDKYAIFNATGNVYLLTKGAVMDDPFILITPVSSPKVTITDGQ